MTTNPKKGAPPGNKNAAKPVRAKSKTIRLYPDDLANLAALLAAGYAATETDVIRQALHEVKQRL